MSALEVVGAAVVGAVLALAVFVGWVWWEWCVRPVRIAKRYHRG
jgi:hypothetical protein